METEDRINALETQDGNHHDLMPLPKGIQIEESGGNFTMRRRWASVNLVGSAAIMFLILNGFIIYVWYYIDHVIILLPLTTVVLGITYYFIAFLLNSTQVRVSNNCLTVQHGPLPWFSFGNRAAPTSDIQVLRFESEYHLPHEGITTYGLYAVLSYGPPLNLLAGSWRPNLGEEHYDQIKFIKQRLEKHLGIEVRRDQEDSCSSNE